jgi:hypothetical protein
MSGPIFSPNTRRDNQPSAHLNGFEILKCRGTESAVRERLVGGLPTGQCGQAQRGGQHEAAD